LFTVIHCLVDSLQYITGGGTHSRFLCLLKLFKQKPKKVKKSDPIEPNPWVNPTHAYLRQHQTLESLEK